LKKVPPHTPPQKLYTNIIYDRTEYVKSVLDFYCILCYNDGRGKTYDKRNQSERYSCVIRESFGTVAKEFGLTERNAPRFTANGLAIT